MKQIVLDENYKYIFNEVINTWELCYQDKLHPKEPDKIYKYYSCNIENIASLHDGYFWLANPVTFNDPFDCNLNLVEHEDNSIKNLPFNAWRNRWDNIGITCFSRIIDDPLMWAHYTNNYHGFAIKFKKLSVAHIEGSNDIMDFAPVIYTDTFKVISNTSPIAKGYVLTVKSKRWSYEKEWRIIKTIQENERRLYFKRDIIEEVYIGHKILDSNEAIYHLITNIVEEKYSNASIYVVYPHPHKLELKFENIYPVE